jgi:hypothetical protein
LAHDQKRLDFYEFLVTKVISGQAAERPKGVARKAEAFQDRLGSDRFPREVVDDLPKLVTNLITIYS